MKILLQISFQPTCIDVLRLFYSGKGVHRRRPVCTNSHRLANEPKYIIDKSPMEKLCPLYGFSIDSQIEFQVSIFTYALRAVMYYSKYIGIWGHTMPMWTRRGGRWSKKSLFLSTFRVKNVHVEVGGGQKRAKLCPRSH